MMTNATALENASAVDMLDAFRVELLAHRPYIETCGVPVFDVVIRLLETCIAEVEGSAGSTGAA
jgi:hypothetical protein